MKFHKIPVHWRSGPLSKGQFGQLQRERLIQICHVLIFSWHLTSVEMYDFGICSSLTFRIEFYRIGFKDCNCNILLLTYICVNIWPTLAFVHILNSMIATKDFSFNNILWTRIQISVGTKISFLMIIPE